MNEKKNNQKFVQSILFLYHDGGTLPTSAWRSLVALAVIEYVTKVCVVVFTCDVGATACPPDEFYGLHRFRHYFFSFFFLFLKRWSN